MQKLAAKNQVIKVIADQCAFNLRGAHGLHRKSTGILTNNSVIAQAVNKRCSKDHIHEVIIGGDKSAKSQVYPRELISTILEAYKKSLSLEEIYYTTWETIDLENDKIDQIYAEYWTEVDQIGGATERECHPVDELPELLEEPVQPFRESDMEPGGSLHAEKSRTRRIDPTRRVRTTTSSKPRTKATSSRPVYAAKTSAPSPWALATLTKTDFFES